MSKKVKDQNYTSNDITVLSDRDHVHKRLGMYAGNTNPITYNVPIFTSNSLTIKPLEFVPAVFKTIGEILDNSIDELIQIQKKNKVIEFNAEPEIGSYTISDNGRGVPIDLHSTGKHTPELVFGSLRAGRNFGDNQQTGVIGMNGMGASITNYCSEFFNITINRDKKSYNQTFTKCASAISKPKIETTNKTSTGTCIKFKLDSTVFKHGTSLPEELIRNRAMEIAFNNPEITVKYNGSSFNFKKGLLDIVQNISKQFYVFETDDIKFYVIFDVSNQIDEQIFTWVNSSLLYDGGICNTQFFNAFVDKTIEHLAPIAKKQRCEVTKNDIRKNLLIFGCLKIEKPEYDAQSKTRLTGPNLKKQFTSLIDDLWKQFSRQHKVWLEEVIERANQRHHASAEKKAVKELSQRPKKIPGLMDASNSNRMKCILTITEGLSASSMISDVRDPSVLATFPLSGKINNVFGFTASDLFQMPKIIHLIQAIGLIPGKKAIRNDLRYGQIWLSTDADPDGDDICSLLINLFFQFWPELFDPKQPAFIKRLVAPNVVVYKGNVRHHFSNRAAYENDKHKYKNWTVEYYKGLGSMIADDWKIILNDSTYQISLLDTDSKLGETLQLLFDDGKAEQRKLWINGEI